MIDSEYTRKTLIHYTILLVGLLLIILAVNNYGQTVGELQFREIVTPEGRVVSYNTIEGFVEVGDNLININDYLILSIDTSWNTKGMLWDAPVVETQTIDRYYQVVLGDGWIATWETTFENWYWVRYHYTKPAEVSLTEEEEN